MMLMLNDNIDDDHANNNNIDKFCICFISHITKGNKDDNDNYAGSKIIIIIIIKNLGI